MLIFLVLSGLLSLFYLMKIYHEPVHPDSAEFIYAGMLQRLWGKKEIFIKKEEGREIPASLNFTEFPPSPRIENYEKYSGAFPLFRDKMFVWWFFEKIFKYFPLKAEGFRIINTVLIFTISNVFYLTITHYIDYSQAIIFSLFFQITLMLPHFDFYQIHAEEWGILLLMLELYLLVVMDYSVFFPIVYGIILALLFLYIKITFGLTILYFLVSPVFFFGDWIFFRISLYFFLLTFLLVIMVFAITGNLNSFLRTFNILHWKKYQDGASTSRSNDQRESIFSIKQFLKNYYNELIIILFFAIKFFLRILSSVSFARVEIFILCWLLVAMIEIGIQGKFYPSHFLPLTIPGLIFIFYNFDYLTVVIMVFLLKIFYRFFIFSNESIMKKYGKQSQNPFLETMLSYREIGNYIKSNSNITQKILCIGYLSPVYVMAERRGALGIFEAGVTTEPIDLDKKYGAKWHWWLMNAMINEEPKFIIDTNGIVNAMELRNSSGILLNLVKSGNNYRIFQPDFSEKFEYPLDIGEKIFNKNNLE